VHIYNRSQQDIAFASVRMLIKADTSPTSKTYMVTAEFGDPQLRRSPQTTAPDRLLKPGQHAIIRVADSQYAPLDRDGVDSPSVSFSVNEVIFADGTMWYIGAILTRDPANPAMFNVIPKPKLNHARKLTKPQPASSKPDDATCSHYSLERHGYLPCNQQNTTNTCDRPYDYYWDTGQGPYNAKFTRNQLQSTLAGSTPLPLV
jgi:hypothetical protein